MHAGTSCQPGGCTMHISGPSCGINGSRRRLACVHVTRLHRVQLTLALAQLQGVLLACVAVEVLRRVKGLRQALDHVVWAHSEGPQEVKGLRGVVLRQKPAVMRCRPGPGGISMSMHASGGRLCGHVHCAVCSISFGKCVFGVGAGGRAGMPLQQAAATL
jgi:hypothetical protein